MKKIFLILLLCINMITLFAQLDPFEKLSLIEDNCWLDGEELGLYSHFNEYISDEVKEIINEIEHKVFLSNNSKLGEGQNPYQFKRIMSLNKVASNLELELLLNHHKGLIRIYSTLILIKRNSVNTDWFQLGIKSLSDNEQLFNYYDCGFYPFYTGAKIIELLWNKLSIKEQKQISILYADSDISYVKEEKLLSYYYFDLSKLWKD